MISKFLSGLYNRLLPTTERRRVMSDLDSVFKEINDSTKNTFSILGPDTGTKLKARRAIEKGIEGRLSAVEEILGVINKLNDNRSRIEDIVESTFKTLIIRETMDFAELNIVIYIDSIRDFNKFSRAYAIALVASDREAHGHKLSGIEKTAIEYVEDRNNVARFHAIFKILDRPFKDILKSLKDLKGIKAEADFNEASAGLRQGATDPFKMGFLPPEINPAMWLGLAYNNWVSYQYESAIIEYDMIQASILSLEQGEEGMTGESVEKQLKYYQGQLAVVGSKIKTIEESNQ